MLSSQNFLPYKYSDSGVLVPNFKAIGETQVELHNHKFKKLEACYSSPFPIILSQMFI